ncbi:MAG: glycosyltransferase family 39 protein [Acidobacteriota bacterium]|nr:glycosyltransferase family 39 protein [Acidobacteriota bacterium]HOY98554.1 glycosyltransferase family 39 protein [Candidatus Aminicenantes bacterium]MDD8033708.1 glycosyltransferase family 39 protein [Acidobacteriota bacterium]MDD8039767.1 glycosyltransferase family 39 protein [Acidobacteriota bacterium]MDW3228129.1 glycosyltransferase family 39 protein [Acidobacteriota bacterium]
MTRRTSGTTWGIFLFWGAALVLSFLNLSGDLMNDDEGTYLYAAWRTGLGEVPYRDFSLVQAPLGFYLGAAVFKLFGPAVWPARALSVLFLLGAAFLVFESARRFLKLKTGFALAAAGVFLFNKHVFFLGRSFMPDVPMIFFGTAALFFALRAESSGPDGGRASQAALLAGVMAGLSALAKINGVLIFAGYPAFLFLEAVRRRKTWKTAASRAASAAAGFAASFAVPFGFFLVFVPGTFDAVVGFQAARESAASVPFILQAGRRIAHLIGNHNYGLAAGALAALSAGRAGAEENAAGLRRIRVLLWTSAAAVLAVIFVPGDFFIRYAVFAFVPLALLFGAGGEALAEGKTIGRRITLGFVAALTLLCLGPTLSPKKILARDEGTRAAAAFIRQNTKPADYVFGDDPFLNFLARRPCPPDLVDVSEAMIEAGRITTAEVVEDCDLFNVKMVFVETGVSAHHLVKLKDYAAFRGYLSRRFRPAAAIRREFLNVEFFIR